MPRIRVDEPAERIDRVSRKPVRRVERVDSPVSVPADAAFWSIRSEQGKKLSSFSHGAQVYTWPIAEFTVETIRERWGGGQYTVFFTNAKGAARGRRPIGIEGAPVASPEPRTEVVPPAAMVHEDSLERSIRLLTAVDGLASRKASEMVATQSEFLRSAQSSTVQLFQAAMGQKLAEQKMQAQALPAQLEQVLVRFDQRLSQIEQALAEEDPDDDDPDNDDPDAEPSGVPYPEKWSGVSDMLYRVLVRQMPTLEKMLPGLVDKWLADVQAKARAAEAAAQAAQNGAAAAGVAAEVVP